MTGCPTHAAGGLYRPRLALDRFVRLRDGHCSSVGCRLPAQLCDLDHVIAHPFGPTCACNLIPLCRRHHRMKHEGGWTLRRLRGGDLIWTAPTGHRYHRPPPPLLPRPLIPRPPLPESDGRPTQLLRHVQPDGGLADLLRPRIEPEPKPHHSKITSPSLAMPPHLAERLTRPPPSTDGPPPF